MSQLINRPQGDARKIHSKNEFELCYLRHKYLRRVTFNPTPAEMAPYTRIAKNFAYKTFTTYLSLFRLVGFEKKDIISIATVQIVSYLGLFALERNEDKFDKFLDVFYKINNRYPDKNDLLAKNKANFTSFIKQRMEDFVRVCRQKARNIKGMQTDEFLVFYGPGAPPVDITNITANYHDYGYRKMDLPSFRTIKKKLKGQKGPIFVLDGINYIVVEVDHRNLELYDFVGADANPHESLHNMNPEALYSQAEFEHNVDQFTNSSEKARRKKLRKFISLHHGNPRYTEEVNTAIRMLRKL